MCECKFGFVMAMASVCETETERERVSGERETMDGGSVKGYCREVTFFKDYH